MRNIARLSDNDRRELFRNTADKMGLNDAIVEKDFWVCFTLDYLFHRSPWKESITFKGGTSLSKAFHLISRFSEDIDLILDWRVLGYGKPCLVCPVTDRAFLSVGSMSGRENDLRAKTAGRYDARGYFRKRLSRSLGRRLPMKIKLIDFGVPEHQRPYRPHGNDAGADVYLPYDCTLQPGEIAKIPLGFGLEIPDGYAGYIVSPYQYGGKRSGL